MMELQLIRMVFICQIFLCLSDISIQFFKRKKACGCRGLEATLFCFLRPRGMVAEALEVPGIVILYFLFPFLYF